MASKAFIKRINQCEDVTELIAEIKIIARILSRIENVDECMELIDQLNAFRTRIIHLSNYQINANIQSENKASSD